MYRDNAPKSYFVLIFLPRSWQELLFSFYGAESGRRRKVTKTWRSQYKYVFLYIQGMLWVFLYESLYPDYDKEYPQTDTKSWYYAWQLMCGWPGTARDLVERENIYSPKRSIQLRNLTYMVRIGNKTVFYFLKCKAYKCKYNLKKIKTF